jgi:hypothetical protein
LLNTGYFDDAAASAGAPDIREVVGRLLNAELDIHFDTDHPGGRLSVLPVLQSGLQQRLK